VKTIIEEKISFCFDDRWQIEKWDSAPLYRDGIDKLSGELTDHDGSKRREGTKAVDFVGLLDNEELYLIEVKDFRGHRIENQKRQEGELALEIGLKVRDTLAGLTAGVARRKPEPWLEPCIRVILAQKRPPCIVAWILEDPTTPAEWSRKRAVREDVRLKQMKQRLSWVTRRVWVASPFDRDPGVPGVTATNLPGAGQR
jgi:hypothetical protein